MPHTPPFSSSSPAPKGRRLLFAPGSGSLTVDPEEWYDVCGPAGAGEGEGVALRRPSNVERDTARLTELLGVGSARATVFVLGRVARANSALVRRLAAAGHEIASHGESHRRMDSLSFEARRREIRESRRRLEDLSGRPVAGFRAAEWSIRSPADPTLRILAEEGYSFDASGGPIAPLGDRRNPPFPYRLDWPDGLSLDVVPPLSTRFGRHRLPAGGSWVARLLPFPFVGAALDEASEARSLAVLTLHPWELDPAHPTDHLPWLPRFVHHAGLARIEGRLADSIASLTGPFAPIGAQLARSEIGPEVDPPIGGK